MLVPAALSLDGATGGFSGRTGMLEWGPGSSEDPMSQGKTTPQQSSLVQPGEKLHYIQHQPDLEQNRRTCCDRTRGNGLKVTNSD